MDLPPQKFREMVFQLLFSFDMGGEVAAEVIPFLMGELAVSKRHVSEAYAKAQLVWGQREQLDELIKERSRDYSLERIKTVEKSVLRLALFELLIEKELNAKIIVSEAHRLTRKFSALEGAQFVNAVLETQDAPSLPTPPEQAAL